MKHIIIIHFVTILLFHSLTASKLSAQWCPLSSSSKHSLKGTKTVLFCRITFHHCFGRKKEKEMIWRTKIGNREGTHHHTWKIWNKTIDSLARTYVEFMVVEASDASLRKDVRPFILWEIYQLIPCKGRHKRKESLTWQHLISVGVSTVEFEILSR